MSDSTETKIYPLSHSADGKLNAYSQRCDAVGQMMNYAACQWRLSVLDSKQTIRTPADWSACTEARRVCRCPAEQMRQEESLKGHAIYFKDRNEVRKTWMVNNPWVAATPAPLPPKLTPIEAGIPRGEIRPAVAAGKGKSMFDAIGEGTDYAAAINATAPVVAPAPAPAPKPAPAPAPRAESLLKAMPMQPGESPLAYARRLSAARQSA